MDTGGVQSTIHKWQGVSFAEDRGDGTVDLSQGEGYDSRHIDWILFLDGLPENTGCTRLQPLQSKVITDSMASGRYPSDHFPVSTTFRLKQSYFAYILETNGAENKKQKKPEARLIRIQLIF